MKKRLLSVLILVTMIFNLFKIYTPVYGNSTDIEAFPESYRPYINALIAAHPNWVFEAYETGVDWYELLEYQADKDRSLIDKTANPEYYFSTKEGDYDPETDTYIGKSGPNWVVPNDVVIEHYMDPRNFLNDTDVFMFLKLDYNAAVHTADNIEILLERTWMHNKKLEDDATMTYAEAFAKTGKEAGISSFFLASRVALEQGSGTSPLITGNYSGYEGYYNYYNIGASGSTTTEVIVNGLKQAKSQGWDTRYKSLYGGAVTISKKFVARNQNTLYFQRFDVVNGISYHQYMQNIQAPYTEGHTMRSGYNKVGLLDEAYVFTIPVYENMPAYACPLPTDGLEITPPTASLSAGNVDKINGTMTVNINQISAVNGVAKIEIRAYSNENAADDLYTYKALVNSDGSYTATVNIANHNMERGSYTMEAYITDNAGVEEFVGSVTMTMPELSTPRLMIKQEDGVLTFVLIGAEAYLGIEKVSFPTWSVEDGQDDLVWYRGFNEEGIYKVEVYAENHPSDSGRINVHVYITDGAGNQQLVCAQVVQLRDFNLIYGDVNMDTVIDSQDALVVLKAACRLHELSYDEKDAADVNYDGIYNAFDALLILQHAAGIKEIEAFTW